MADTFTDQALAIARAVLAAVEDAAPNDEPREQAVFAHVALTQALAHSTVALMGLHPSPARISAGEQLAMEGLKSAIAEVLAGHAAGESLH